MENIEYPRVRHIRPMQYIIGQSHPPIDPPADCYRLQTSPLRGFIHYADESLLTDIKPGTPLNLIPEPANPHDKYAVRVHLCTNHTKKGNKTELHIGYLPRQSNHVVSRLLRQGAPLRAEVAWVSSHLESHQQNPPISLHVLWDNSPELKKQKTAKRKK